MKIQLLINLGIFISTIAIGQKLPAIDLTKSIQLGKEIYSINCQSCHQENGEGLEGIYPPIAKSDFLMADKIRSIKIILNGANGPMQVNGVTYEGEMPGYPLSDQEVINLLNYIRNSFGNKGEAVTMEDIKKSKLQ